MTLFRKNIGAVDDPTVTSDEASIIYSHLSGGNSPTSIFTKHGYKIKLVEQVVDEILLIETTVNNLMVGNRIPSTLRSLVSQVTSDMFPDDIATIIADIIIYKGVYDVDRTYTEFKDSFTTD